MLPPAIQLGPRLAALAPDGFPTFNFNWQSVSATAGLTRRNFYFQWPAGAIKSAQVIGFLRALHRQAPGKILLLWDGAPIRRSRLVTAFVREQHAWLRVGRLPAYAPELNPVEYRWAYGKRNELANFCPKEVWQLGSAASQALKRIRRHRPQLITAFFHQADLF